MANPLLFSSFFIVYLTAHIDFFRDFELWQQALFFLCTVFTMAFAFTPSTLVCFVGGYLWGLSALPWVIVSYVLASVIGFEVPKWMDEGRLNRTLHTIPKVAKFIDGVSNESFWWVLVTRLLPALPFAVVNVVFSLLQVTRRNYYLGGILGMLPRTCFAVWLGSQGDSFIHNDFIYRKEVWIPAIIVIVLLALRYLWVKFWR